jgi:glutamate dehydrogenase/leucine dehydrogenase
METKRTPFDKYLAQLEKASKVLNLDPRIYARLQVPKLLLRGTVIVEQDDGSWKTSKIYRAHHSRARGIPQGGTRWDVAVCESEVKFLSAMMTMKNTIVGIWHGGGKGGICGDKFALSMGERERTCRGYIRAIEPWIGDRKDGPAPDVNTGGQEMAWFRDELEEIRGYDCAGSFTGKPVYLGGSLGRADATALGAVYATEAMLEKIRSQEENITTKKGTIFSWNPSKEISIQGFGNAGNNYFRLMAARGHKIISVSDRSGVIYKKDGFDYADLHAFCYDDKGQKIHKVSDYPKKDTMSSEEAEKLSLKAYIFAPAAFEDTINADMAKKLECKFGIELANGPCTEEADEILAKRGITFISDIYSSGGGVRVSSAEKSQDLSNAPWTEEQVNVWLKTRMFKAFDLIEATREKYNLPTFRESAVVYAVSEVAEAMQSRGNLDKPLSWYTKTIDLPPVVMVKGDNKFSLKYILKKSTSTAIFYLKTLVDI